MSITITLNQLKEKQVEKNRFTKPTWEKLLKACGGENADLNKPIPLTEILDLTNLTTALWCFICLPEHEHIPADFAFRCAKMASVYSKDERVQNCVRMIENYLNGDVSKEELREIAQADAAIGEAPNIIAENAATTVYSIATHLFYSNITSAIVGAANAAETVAYDYNTLQYDVNAYNAEKQKQANLFRMLMAN